MTATNEPRRIECGSPDFIVTHRDIPVGYVEAKDVGTDLDDAESSDQLKRYRASLRNLILTDYLEFRLYRNGELIHTARLGRLQKDKSLRQDAAGQGKVEALLGVFYDTDVPIIRGPRDLAERMARSARLLHDLIRQAFAHEGRVGDLHAQYDAFKRVLISDLSVDQFADMYAQTIAYGLFAARCNHVGSGFRREHAGRELPRTNPFLRRLFNTIAGVDLDDRISWAADDLAELLGKADIASILEDFGNATRREDPVVHFYETFLAAYDPKLRESRGVYYTPEPVVEYIVSSVDAILRSEFGLKAGLADRTIVKLKLATPHGKKKFKEVTSHRVQILDPACGTGTFLHAVIAHVFESFSASRGLWQSYVTEHLLPRLYGFELLMAPYAVAHMKLGLQLKQLGYDFAESERLRVFLTNSLDDVHELAGLPLFAQWLADEAVAASEVKLEVPIMVVLGNPPYSNYGMMNKSEWILEQIKDYKKGLNEKKLNLDDDFIKFIRFGQSRIQQTGYGVLAFITSHTYLDGLTHRRMRESLMETFDDIYVFDLHGNSKKKERSPTGDRDENVFDIQQGVAISIFVKRSATHTETRVRHADLWGLREHKYSVLSSSDVTTTKWQALAPESPHLFFVPKGFDFRKEYEEFWSLSDIFPVRQNGIKTDRDGLFIDFDRDELERRMEVFYSAAGLEPEFREQYNVNNSSSYDLLERRTRTSFDRAAIRPFLYRPFDVRWLYYKPGLTSRPAWEVMRHMLEVENVAILTTRQTADQFSALVTTHLAGHKSCAAYDINTVFPLYCAPEGYSLLGETRVPNLTEKFTSALGNAVRMRYAPEVAWLTKDQFGPLAAFAYIYAVLYSATYQRRYQEFLRIEYARIPIAPDRATFESLAELGKVLINLHLMRSIGKRQPTYPKPGDNRVERVRFDSKDGRVYINASQYFEGISEAVWSQYIGGYQVAERWLTDRINRFLTFDDLDHYRRVVSVLGETIGIQQQIDAVAGWAAMGTPK